MKIAIHTSALGDYVSGGINCIVSVLNEVKKLGHEVCCFVDQAPFRSDWLPAEFPVLPSASQQYEDFDGILVSPFSPTAKAVAEHKKAQDRFYWVHTNEGLFTYNGAEWTNQAIDSYSLPLKIFCTSNYLQILMEQVYKRNVIGITVPPGFNPQIFNDSYVGRNPLINNHPIEVAIFGRGGWIRGVDVAEMAIRAVNKCPIKINIIPDGTRDQTVIAKCFQKSNIYIDASRLAGSPTPVKEAMACRCLPIVTYYGTNDFILSGVNGYIVPPDNPEAITAIIHDLYGSLDYQRMAKAAMESVQYYTWDKIAHRFLYAIYEGSQRNDLLQQKEWR